MWCVAGWLAGVVLGWGHCWRRCWGRGLVWRPARCGPVQLHIALSRLLPVCLLLLHPCAPAGAGRCAQPLPGQLHQQRRAAGPRGGPPADAAPGGGAAGRRPLHAAAHQARRAGAGAHGAAPGGRGRGCLTWRTRLGMPPASCRHTALPCAAPRFHPQVLSYSSVLHEAQQRQGPGLTLVELDRRREHRLHLCQARRGCSCAVPSTRQRDAGH